MIAQASAAGLVPSVAKAVDPVAVLAAVRAWLGSHLVPVTTGLTAALRSLYGDAGNAGGNLAADAIPNATLVEGAVKIDWADWSPGNQPASDVAKLLPERLESLDTTIQGVTDTQLDLIAGRLADGLAAGSNMDTIGASIDDVLGTNSRGVMIARTETTRAVEEASQSTYAENGVEEWEWLTAEDPCPDCDPFDGQVFPVGNDDPSIPYHPGCRCASAPVLPENASSGDDSGDDES